MMTTDTLAAIANSILDVADVVHRYSNDDMRAMLQSWASQLEALRAVSGGRARYWQCRPKSEATGRFADQAWQFIGHDGYMQYTDLFDYRELFTAAPPAEPDLGIDAMVNRFLRWPLPKTFAPDCGISFTPLGHPNGWPIGTNLLTATEARAMLEYVLAAGAPTAQQPLDDAANNAGVAAGSRNASPSESVTRGRPPASPSRRRTMRNNDEHVEALREVRLGVELDQANDVDAIEKLAALDVAIAALTAVSGEAELTYRGDA